MLDVEDFTAEGKTDKTEIIDLGQPFSIKCPPHGPNYGAVYTWTNKDQLQFKRDPHRAISPEGELFIMYVTQKDVDEISDFGGINCKIDAANTFYNSGLVTLKKRTAGKKSCFIKEVKNTSECCHCISMQEFLRTQEKCIEKYEVQQSASCFFFLQVFLKFPKYLYNSTMHKEQVFFQCDYLHLIENKGLGHF